MNPRQSALRRDAALACVAATLGPALALLVAAGAGAQAAPPPYAEVEVTDGGTIVGRARLEGSAPQLPPATVPADAQACGHHEIAPETFVVSADGALANVVVWLNRIASGKPIDRNAVASIENRECRFVPHVQAVVAGTPLEIRNADPLLHNTHLFLNDDSLANLAVPAGAPPIRRTLDRPGVVRVSCDVHAWMRAHILVFPHPYFATTGEDGAFRIDCVPPGTYELRVWHEAASTRPVQVEVPARGEAAVEISLEPRG